MTQKIEFQPWMNHVEIGKPVWTVTLILLEGKFDLHLYYCTCSGYLIEIYRAKVSAETFAEIVNGFIDPISYKSMVIIHMHIMRASSYHS